MLAIPTPEHYLPLLYVLAQQQDGEPTDLSRRGIRWRLDLHAQRESRLNCERHGVTTHARK